MENVENLLLQILNKLGKMEEKQDCIEKKLDSVVDQVAGLTEFKMATTGKLDQISKDVRFVKHKAFQNEEDIFSLQEAFKFRRTINS